MNTDAPTKYEKIWTIIVLLFVAMLLVLLIFNIFRIWSISYGIYHFLLAGAWLSVAYMNKNRYPKMAKFCFIISIIKVIFGIVGILI